MIYNRHYICTIFCGLILLAIACNKDEHIDNRDYSSSEYQVLSETLDLPQEPFDYSVALPKHLFRGSSINRINVGAEHKATLGRVLFYDTRLSSTNTVSCASCHKQEFAFADNLAVSDGVMNLKSKRNSLALAATPNLSASYAGTISESAFGWDHSHDSSVDQSLAALLNNAEMGNSDIELVVEKLNQDPIYSILSTKAFGVEQLDGVQLLESLDAFMNSITAFNTKFDEAIKDNELFSGSGYNEILTAQENQGKHLYMTHCASCHSVKQDIQLVQIANNGLDEIYADKGVGHLKGSDFDGMFKVPFLRNIAVTAPYMHDGRFNTLEEVVDHYSHDVKLHKNLSFLLKDKAFSNHTNKPNFSDDNKKALIAFLHTLTDEKLLAEQKYSDPFIGR